MMNKALRNSVASSELTESKTVAAGGFKLLIGCVRRILRSGHCPF